MTREAEGPLRPLWDRGSACTPTNALSASLVCFCLSCSTLSALSSSGCLQTRRWSLLRMLMHKVVWEMWNLNPYNACIALCQRAPPLCRWSIEQPSHNERGHRFWHR